MNDCLWLDFTWNEMKNGRFGSESITVYIPSQSTVEGLFYHIKRAFSEHPEFRRIDSIELGRNRYTYQVHVEK